MLRFVTLVSIAPIPLTVWLVALAPRAEWENTRLGAGAWWILPAGLIALSCVLPAALFFLHGRYVLSLAEDEKGGLRLVTFLVWGRRTTIMPATLLRGATTRHDEGRLVTGVSVSVNAPSTTLVARDGRRLIFDRQGEAPAGWDAIERLTEPR